MGSGDIEGLVSGHTTIDMDILSGDKGGGVAGEENSGSGEVVGHAPAVHRDELPITGLKLRRLVFVTLDGDPSWRDHIHGDSPWGDLGGKTAVEAILPGLGGDVGGKRGDAARNDF